MCAFCQLCFLFQIHFWSLSHQHCFSVVGVFVLSTIIQPWKQWGNAFSLCVHFVNCAFYFRYTFGHCLIDIVSLLWGCLSRRQLFSHGNGEVMHSACVCIFCQLCYLVEIHFWWLSHRHCFSAMGVFISSTIIQPWEQWSNPFSLCVHFVSCAFYFRHTSGDCLIDIVFYCGDVCLIDDYSAMETVR